jgi:hypothetical protein
MQYQIAVNLSWLTHQRVLFKIYIIFMQIYFLILKNQDLGNKGTEIWKITIIYANTTIKKVTSSFFQMLLFFHPKMLSAII